MASNPLTDHERERIRELHDQGKSLTGIARELGRAKSTVGKAADAMGLSWDTSRTAPATQVKQASNRERRATAVQRLYTRAERILDRLDADVFKAVGFSKDGYAKVTEIAADAIPGAEERALAGMAVNLLNAAARLEAVDAGHTDNTEAKGILGRLDEAMQAAYGQLSHTSSASTRLPDPDATDTDS